MSVIRNPFVDYLNRYTTASPDHEAAFDEFLSQVKPPSGEPLRLETRVEAYLKACFSQTNAPSIILTGNAGDGKTYLCRQIVNAYTGRSITSWEQIGDGPIERDGRCLYVVKDLSELGDRRGVEVLRGLVSSLAGDTTDRYLIAANEGRLRALCASDESLNNLYTSIDHQLRDGSHGDSRDFVVINLNDVTTSSFVSATLRWMTHDEHWRACQHCPIFERCPVRHNAHRLSNTYVASRVQMLYQLLEHLDIHVTVRDMLIHLAFTLTGNQRCDELQSKDRQRENLSDVSYYENIWGGKGESQFQRKARVVQHLERLQIGDHSLFEIDDFIVNGGDSPTAQAEHQQLFAQAVDLNHRRFEQDRRAYVEGGAEQRAEAKNEAAALMRWLPHCRRKLFFEWQNVDLVNRLIPFLYLDTYLRLLHGEQRSVDQVRRDLVLGLNRAFSRLYLTDADHLYVTTQYLHSAEQPRPLVRLSIPTSGIELHIDRRQEPVYDRDRPDLWLRIAPPPALALREGAALIKPIAWRLNLITFEYLMRLAHGGTYNILADECELSVRSLKDGLLSAFAQEQAQTGLIEFFVAERRRYVLKKLHIDEQGNLRSGG